MAVYKKCDKCGRVWIVSIQQIAKKGRYECPECEKERNARDRAREAKERGSQA